MFKNDEFCRRLVALALGGYSPGREKEWGQTCLDLGILSSPSPQSTERESTPEPEPEPAVGDPYLRAAFVFLACHASRVSRQPGDGGAILLIFDRFFD